MQLCSPSTKQRTRGVNKLQNIHNCVQLYKQYITSSNYFALVTDSVVFQILYQKNVSQLQVPFKSQIYSTHCALLTVENNGIYRHHNVQRLCYKVFPDLTFAELLEQSLTLLTVFPLAPNQNNVSRSHIFST